MGNRVIRRDPFGRLEVIRTATGPGQCAWCGEHRRTLWTYAIAYDGGRIVGTTNGRRFCSVKCWEAYVI